MCHTALPDPAWGPTLLCCVTVFLLGTSSANPGVIQSPRRIIKAKGGRSILKCTPISGHSSVFWYQQTQGQELKFLIQHYEKAEQAKGDMPSRFSVQQFNDYHSEMNMSALQLEDSAVYFCASSPQPYRVTGFLSLNFPAPTFDVLERMMQVDQLCRVGCPSITKINTDGLTFALQTSLSHFQVFSMSEPTNAGVTQTPRHKVTEKGQEASLRCEPISGHSTLFWYKQTTLRGLEFLTYFHNQQPIDETGIPKERFSAQMPNATLSTLKIQPAQPQDSAVYLCASSSATELQNHTQLGQKPYASPSLSVSQKHFSTGILGSSHIRKDMSLMSSPSLEKTKADANEYHIEKPLVGKYVCGERLSQVFISILTFYAPNGA
ncbi:hypothetical protein STEG23_035750 [Scotinomys teguina]